MLNLQRIIINFIFEILLYIRMKFMYLSFICFVYFCFIAKQIIDSGFFLFQAEQRKQKVKKKRMMATKISREAMLSSDDDFV